jgi:hypothetical protein
MNIETLFGSNRPTNVTTVCEEQKNRTLLLESHGGSGFFCVTLRGNPAVLRTFHVLGPVAFRPPITRGLALAQFTQLYGRNV